MIVEEIMAVVKKLKCKDTNSCLPFSY